jgi:hypothetical protein
MYIYNIMATNFYQSPNKFLDENNFEIPDISGVGENSRVGEKPKPKEPLLHHKNALDRLKNANLDNKPKTDDKIIGIEKAFVKATKKEELDSEEDDKKFPNEIIGEIRTELEARKTNNLIGKTWKKLRDYTTVKDGKERLSGKRGKGISGLNGVEEILNSHRSKLK